MKSSILAIVLPACALSLCPLAACGGSTDPGGGGGGQSNTTSNGSTTASPCDKTGSCGPFACGSLMCNGATQYCLDSYTEGMSDDVYTCEPLPKACEGNPTCSCVETETGHSCPGGPACADGAVLTCSVVP